MKDLITNAYSQLKERRKKIVRTDTATINDLAKGGKQLIIRKYYKVVADKRKNIHEPEHKHSH